jgi:hypothetical protein
MKNQQRFTFGCLYPPEFVVSTSASDSDRMQTQCLLQARGSERLEVLVRFLQLIVDEGREETVERSVSIGPESVEVLSSRPRSTRVAYPNRKSPAIAAVVRLELDKLAGDAYRVTVVVRNTNQVQVRGRAAALFHTLLSAHTVLHCPGGAFASPRDPPPQLASAAALCRNQGAWPVLVGEAGSRDTMLSAPIILEDYPRVSEQSPGDLYDATEIDELLTLSILTLSDEEKEQMRLDPRTRELLQRSESLTAEQLMNLHGTMRWARRSD